MLIEDTQDVTPVETTTTPDSSTETETTQPAATEEADTTPAETKDEGEQSVPYSRFKEVNDRLRQLEEKSQKQPAAEQQLPPQAAQIKEHLKELGFVTKEEQEAELRQQKADAALDKELSKLESQWDGKDGRPKFDRQKVIDFAYERGIADPEVAFEAMHKQQIIDWHIGQALNKSKGIKTEASDGSGSSQTGTSNEDLKQAAKQGDANARRTYLKRILRSE